MSIQYIPAPPAKDEEPSEYAFGELQDLTRALAEAQEVMFLQVLHSAPQKPRQGMVAYADGTHWNPGSGKGVYAFNGTTWAFLG